MTKTKLRQKLKKARVRKLLAISDMEVKLDFSDYHRKLLEHENADLKKENAILKSFVDSVESIKGL